ncbi:MAG: DNA-3-methyladenine glycosylase [Verrucomicrobia bacterium]|nr:DNA-3-methyladenine glycosylase [Verrucomicrobiota bacterium]
MPRSSADLPVDFAALPPLERDFYARPVLTVARAAIGQLLVHVSAEGVCAGRIVETEAYRGPEDRAAHSYGGRRTTRTEVMYGAPGLAYLYFVYGMHWQLNLVTTREGAPEAVLIRAVEPLAGLELMAERRGLAPSDRRLTNGPGKLCQAFGLQRAHYGHDLTLPGTLFLAAGPRRRGRVLRSPRIGIDYAEGWIDKPWRFHEADNPWVSRRPSGSNDPARSVRSS